MKKTLGELLSDPLIARIAPDAIRGMDLTQDEPKKSKLEYATWMGTVGTVCASVPSVSRIWLQEGKCCVICPPNVLVVKWL